MIRLLFRDVDGTETYDALSDAPDLDEYVGSVWRAEDGSYVLGIDDAECGRFLSLGEAADEMARATGEPVTIEPKGADSTDGRRTPPDDAGRMPAETDDG